MIDDNTKYVFVVVFQISHRSQEVIDEKKLSMRKLFTVFTHALPWAITRRGNNFQLEMRLKFLKRSYVKFEIGLYSCVYVEYIELDQSIFAARLW